MRIGTKSVLFGAHQFLIHPFFVAAAWWKLYGFPADLRLWVAFFVHDLGYLGKPNMDGPEGETHVELGASLMQRWFGAEWGDFCRYHSRFYAKRDGKPYSRLCVADKLSMCLMPWWVYVPLTTLTGEIKEYMARNQASNGKYANEPRFNNQVADLQSPSKRIFFRGLCDYVRGWVEAHKDGALDTWTPVQEG